MASALPQNTNSVIRLSFKDIIVPLIQVGHWSLLEKSQIRFKKNTP